MCATVKQKTNKQKYSTTGPDPKKERNTVFCILKVIHNVISQLIKQQAGTAKCEIRNIWIDHFFKTTKQKILDDDTTCGKKGTTGKLKHTKR